MHEGGAEISDVQHSLACHCCKGKSVPMTGALPQAIMEPQQQLLRQNAEILRP